MTGVLRLDQQGTPGNKQTSFDMFLEAHALSAVDPTDCDEIPSYLGVDTDGVEVPAQTLERFVPNADRALTEGDDLDEVNTQATVSTPFVHARGWNVDDTSAVLVAYSSGGAIDQDGRVRSARTRRTVCCTLPTRQEPVAPHETQCKR